MHTQLTDETIKDFIKNKNKIVLLQMPNSTPSINQEELLEDTVSKHENVEFGILDVFKYQEFPINQNIRNFPTTLYYKEGELISLNKGTQTQKNIENSIQGIL